MCLDRDSILSFLFSKYTWQFGLECYHHHTHTLTHTLTRSLTHSLVRETRILLKGLCWWDLEVPCGCWELCFGSSYWLGSVNFPSRHLASSQKLPLRIVFCKLRAGAIISCVFVVEAWGQIWQRALEGVRGGLPAQPSRCHSAPWGAAHSWAHGESFPTCGSMCVNNGMPPFGIRSDSYHSPSPLNSMS